MSKFKGMVNTATKRVDDDGHISWDVDIYFDVTKEGIVYASKRNYNPNFIKKMVNSKATRQKIASGDAMVMYGHNARERQYGFHATEVHPLTKEDQFPLGRVTDLSISSSIMNVKMVLVEAPDNYAETIAQYMKHGIGGFSTVFVQKPHLMLTGCDFTLARRFVDNQVHKVIMDSICSDGECGIEKVLEHKARDIVGTHTHLLDNTIQILKQDGDLGKYAQLRETLLTNQKEANKATTKRDKLLLENQNLKRDLATFKELAERRLKTIKLLEEENKRLAIELKQTVVKVKEIDESYEQHKTVFTKNLENTGLVVSDIGEVKLDTSIFRKVFMDSIQEESMRKTLDPKLLISAKTINQKKEPTLERAGFRF